MARDAFDDDVHPVAARRSHRDLLDRTTVEIEGQLRPAEIGGLHKSGAIETDLLLDPKEERQWRMRQLLVKNLQSCREHDSAAGPVVGAQARRRITALDEAS